LRSFGVIAGFFLASLVGRRSLAIQVSPSRCQCEGIVQERADMPRSV
jgi:hypothetical protein